MTQEEKQLLLKDLCARTVYDTVVKVEEMIGDVYLASVDWWGEIGVKDYTNTLYPIENVKPYLRSMSSLTDEEENEYRAINCYEGVFPRNEDALDYALEHHLDIRNLIEKGLALEAPEGMYKNE